MPDHGAAGAAERIEMGDKRYDRRQCPRCGNPQLGVAGKWWHDEDRSIRDGDQCTMEAMAQRIRDLEAQLERRQDEYHRLFEIEQAHLVTIRDLKAELTDVEGRLVKKALEAGILQASERALREALEEATAQMDLARKIMQDRAWDNAQQGGYTYGHTRDNWLQGNANWGCLETLHLRAALAPEPAGIADVIKGMARVAEGLNDPTPEPPAATAEKRIGVAVMAHDCCIERDHEGPAPCADCIDYIANLEIRAAMAEEGS